MDADFEYGIQEHGFHSEEADSKAFPRKTPNHGEGLFPRMRIKVGEDVLQIREPLVAVLESSRMEDTCANCFGARTANALTEEKVKLKRCTGCQKVMYCDKTCQAKNWSFAHKYECKIYKRLIWKWLTTRARAMLQILLRYNNGKITDGQLQRFLQLTHHWDKVSKNRPERVPEVTDGIDGVNTYSGFPMPKEQLEAMFARLDTNCFTLTTPSADRIGLFLDITFASYMNHSCEYNTVVGFDGPVMYAKAIKPIAPDEEILISYIDTTSTYEQRKRELWDRYFFICDCPKCMKGTDTREDNFLTSTSPETEAADSKVTNLMMFHPPDKSVPSLRAVIKLLHQTSVWPITRQPYATLRDELIASLLEAQQFQAAFVQATIRYLRIDPILWPMEHHPTRHMHDWVLAKLSIYISQGVDTTHDTVDLQPYEINFGLLVWMLLNKLVGKSGVCSVPRFQQMIEAKYNEVCQEFATHGLNPASMKGDIKNQWAKMEKIADDGLKKDGEAKETWSNGVLTYS